MRQFAVIGLGRFGYSVAKTLSENNCEVLAIDLNEENVKAVSSFVIEAIQLDATDEMSLRSTGILNVDVAVVSVGDDMLSSILITLLLRDIGVKQVVSKAVSLQHGKILQKVGADKVVFPERDMGVRVANSLISPNVLEHIDVSKGHSIVEIVVPRSFIGKSLIEVGVRHNFGLNIIALKRLTPEINEDGEIDHIEEFDITPDPETIFEDGDYLVVIGPEENINNLRKVV